MCRLRWRNDNHRADAAADGTAGCFNQVPKYCGKLSVEALGTNGQPMMYDFVREDVYRRAVRETCLSKRAWALQERLLSPRVLHFGEGDLFFECHTKDANESFPTGLPRIFDHTTAEHRSRTSLTASWDKVVSMYTAADLTYASDKLVAISGLARAAQHESKDEYFAGLWWQSMEFDLCWNVKTQHLDRREALSHVAPAWSWASFRKSNAHILLINILDIKGFDLFSIIS